LFDTAELGQSIPKAEFKKRELELRASLLKLQYQALEMARFPIIIDFAGVDGAGKGTTMNMLDKWMDPRWIRAIGYQPPSEEEKARPRFWRYWRDIPPKGRMGVYLSGRYSAPLLQRVYGEIDDAEFDDRLAEIIRFENTLADDGALILKFWMHLSRDAQKERLEALSADPMLSYKVKDTDWRNHEHYDKFIDAAEKIITRTNRAAAPWTIVEGVDPYYRHMRVGETIRAELERHLAIHENSPANSSPGKPEPHQTGHSDSLQPLTIFDNLDLSVRFTDGKYPKKKKKLQAKLGELGRKAHEQRQSTVLVFEGPDAAGKGGAIRRTVWSLDARTYRIYQFAAPTDIERAHHYLWRFWSKLPKAGNVSVCHRRRVAPGIRRNQRLREPDRRPGHPVAQVLASHIQGRTAQALRGTSGVAVQTLEAYGRGLAKPRAMGSVRDCRPRHGAVYEHAGRAVDIGRRGQQALRTAEDTADDLRCAR
jgi:polyphosphate kinase 2 (PPK2 family)